MTIKRKYTRAQAARALGISWQAIHQAVKSGRVPTNEDGMLDVDDLEQWRIRRVVEAHEELVKRQNVPNLLGDKRTERHVTIVAVLKDEDGHDVEIPVL